MFLIAIGIAFSINACAGINGLNAPAYALSTKYPLMSIGTYNFLFHSLLIIVQLAVLGKLFKLEDLMQVPANLILAVFINISIILCKELTATSLLSQILLILASCIITAIGVSMEVWSKAWMLPTEMTAKAISTKSKKDFSFWKMMVDCSILLIAVILCVIFFGNPLGTSDTNVLGWGTIVLAICVGPCVKFTQPVVDKVLGIL